MSQQKTDGTVKVISEEFNKGTPYKGEGRAQGCLLVGRGGEGAVTRRKVREHLWTEL